MKYKFMNISNLTDLQESKKLEFTVTSCQQTCLEVYMYNIMYFIIKDKYN